MKTVPDNLDYIYYAAPGDPYIPRQSAAVREKRMLALNKPSPVLKSVSLSKVSGFRQKK